MHLQAEGHHGLPATPEAGGEAWSRFSLTASEGTKHAGAVTSASQPPERREDTLPLCKAPSLWKCVPEARGATARPP